MRKLNGYDFDEMNALVSTVLATDAAFNRRFRHSGITSVNDNTTEIKEDPDIRQQVSPSGAHKQYLTFSVSYSAIATAQDENSSPTSDWKSLLTDLEQQSRYIGSASRMRTWNRAAGLEPMRVFLEEKVLLTGSVSKPDLYNNFLRELDSEIRILEDVVRLLNEASTAWAFRALRCIGITKSFTRRLGCTASSRSRTLYSSGASYRPALLAAHRRTTCPLPYIDGFKNSRSSVYGISPFQTQYEPQLPGFLAERVYRHPAYLLHKRNRSRSSPHRSCHRFRHDYYALGLVLLEIGLWSPLSELEVTVLRDSSASHRNSAFNYVWPGEPVGGEDKPSGTVRLSEDWLVQTTATINHSRCKIEEHDMWEKLDAEGWPDCLEEAINPDLRRAIQDEQIQNVAATPDNPRDRGNRLRNLCLNRGKIYSVEMLRQSAIRKAERHLAGCMGDKYQDIVLRCLRSDFELSGAAPEGDWLHEFN
ncbi:hypothetical protein BU23DRAFT_571711 [Bimuria novae-zelandiae CBS 107.79]|uniref:Prion-inhibition and propagation HeLo domain-containing protein n=1 Tax=Bimuria novae-zelandiae CBS 107.79 TaxID=1447943 RepID=A0A6A5UVU8_9PLEO|nr:hypothetical protein BU23DRAFT_571711 [Bimuria novae-zelandiae CBS 107.79]